MLAATGSVLALALLVFALVRLHAPDDGSPTSGLLFFWIASAALWLSLTGLWLSIPAARPDRRRARQITLGILFAAALARGAVVMLHTPALSDDIHRYVLDGRNTASGLNPYLVAPIEFVDPALRAHAERWSGQSLIASQVNNPELHTIYLPASQWTFAAIAACIPQDVQDPDTLARIFRAGFVLIELAAMLVLAAALRTLRRNPWWLALYAWHPLAITEIAGSGHQDVIGLLLLVTALFLAMTTPRRLLAGIAALAAAALVKPIVLPVAALMLRGRPARFWLIAAGIGAALTIVICVPLFVANSAEESSTALSNLMNTTARFTAKWAHFGPIYESFLAVITPLGGNLSNDAAERIARTICTALLIVIIALVFLRGRDPWRDCGYIFLAMVLLSPTAHPWYLLWALVLIPAAPLYAIWTASLTLSWGYAALLSPESWHVPLPVWIAAYVPIYAALLFDVFGRKKPTAAT